MNRFSSRPSLRWSRARACSSRSRCCVEVLRRVERGAVDPREHLARGVAAPVRAGEREQLERLDPAGRGRVRAAAEVGEGAVRVERDRLDARVADQVLDQLDLVGLVLGAEALERLLDPDVLARELLLRADVLAHLLLQRGQVVLGDGHALGELEVVVEAVLDRRPDRDPRAGIEVEHGRGEHMGGVVADQLERLGRAVGHDLDALAVGERQREIAHLPVHLHGQRGAREPRADGGGEVGAAGAFLQLLAAAVGKLDPHSRRDASRAGRGRRLRPSAGGFEPAGRGGSSCRVRA